jgi:hypothetical protein
MDDSETPISLAAGPRDATPTEVAQWRAEGPDEPAYGASRKPDHDAIKAKTDDQRKAIATQIQANAALWAQSIAAVQVPGIRASRDAYCAKQAAGPAG